MRRGESGCGRPLQQVPGRLHRVEDPHLEGALDRLALVRARDRQPDREARLAQAGEFLQQLLPPGPLLLSHLVEAQQVADLPIKGPRAGEERGDVFNPGLRRYLRVGRRLPRRD